MAAKIKTGDKAVVLSGKDKGREGKVLSYRPKEGRVVVEGIALARLFMAFDQTVAIEQGMNGTNG